jgi:hypothetical protein
MIASCTNALPKLRPGTYTRTPPLQLLLALTLKCYTATEDQNIDHMQITTVEHWSRLIAGATDMIQAELSRL